MYQDRKVLVTEVFPVETGLADYSVFVDGKTVRVNETVLSPVEVYEFVDRELLQTKRHAEHGGDGGRAPPVGVS